LGLKKPPLLLDLRAWDFKNSFQGFL
jgi:hypothetical protein